MGKFLTFIIVLDIFLFSFISVSFSRRKRQKRTKEQERVATFSVPQKRCQKTASGRFIHQRSDKLQWVQVQAPTQSPPNDNPVRFGGCGQRAKGSFQVQRLALSKAPTRSPSTVQ